MVVHQAKLKGARVNVRGYKQRKPAPLSFVEMEIRWKGSCCPWAVRVGGVNQVKRGSGRELQRQGVIGEAKMQQMEEVQEMGQG